MDVIDQTAKDITSSKPAPTPQMSPRGTERVRRRAAQATNAAQAVEDAKLAPGRRTAAQKAQLKAPAPQIAKFGPSRASVRKEAQAKHREQAAVESGTYAAPESVKMPKLVPGTTPTARELRVIAKLNDKQERDANYGAAKAAGAAVYSSLQGKAQGDRYTRQRKIEKHNATVGKSPNNQP